MSEGGDAQYAVSAEAQNDPFEIWQHIADDSVDLANRIEREFYALFERLAAMPAQGHIRRDLTPRPVRFFPIYSFLVVYQPILSRCAFWLCCRGGET